jgi:glycerol-3-phosphate dehydrogenase
LLGTSGRQLQTPLLKAAVLVTRPLVPEAAVGVACKSRYKGDNAIINKGHRYFFITPWRNTSLIGTFHAPYNGDPDSFQLTEQDIEDFIREVNAALPGAGIARHDIYFAYSGLLPRAEMEGKADSVQLAKHYQVRDHAVEDGIQGLVSVVGVKYTTARDVAEKTVDLLEKKLGKSPTACQTAITPLPEGEIGSFEECLIQELGKRPAGVSAATLRHLIQTYGSEYREILRYGEEDRKWHQPLVESSPVIKAEVLHGIREEMAQKLSDVIFRRTELGTAGHPGALCLKSCAEIMAREMGWEHKRLVKEIKEVESVFYRG